MQDFPVVTLNLEQIRTDPQNAYIHDDGDLQRLTCVISEHGFLVPITVDAASEQNGTYQLVGGEARIEAARLAHLESVPALLATFEDDNHRRAAALALNSHFGKWDDSQLEATLKELEEAGYDLDMTGIESFKLEEIMEATKSPDSFKSYDEDIETEHCCPKCGYEWSGKPN